MVGIKVSYWYGTDVWLGRVIDDSRFHIDHTVLVEFETECIYLDSSVLNVLL